MTVGFTLDALRLMRGRAESGTQVGPPWFRLGGGRRSRTVPGARRARSCAPARDPRRGRLGDRGCGCAFARDRSGPQRPRDRCRERRRRAVPVDSHWERGRSDDVRGDPGLLRLASGPSGAATSEVREGDAAAQLIAAAIADRADCVVIGSHGRTGVARMFLGSAARAVLFNAPCSALIVRGTKMVAGEREQRVAVAT